MDNNHCFEILDYLYSKGLLLGINKEDKFNKLKKEIQHGVVRKQLDGKRKKIRWSYKYEYEHSHGKMYMYGTEKEESKKTKVEIYINKRLINDIDELKKHYHD